MRASLVVLLWLTPCLPAAAVSGIAYQGEARALGGDTLLYTEQHLLRQEQGAPVERYVLYRCPDGAAFARKHVRYGEPPYAPQFEQQDARFGYAEGFSRGRIAGEVFFRRSEVDERRQDAIALGESLVVDAGFDEFVRAKWPLLQEGRSVPLRFLVPSRLSTYGFKVRKTGEQELFGDTVSHYQLALTGLLGWFADAIDVSYRHRDRRLMRFAGLSNIRKSPDENLLVEIHFPPQAEQPLDPQAWAAAQRETLKACPLGG
jgi:hypothetical protein